MSPERNAKPDRPSEETNLLQRLRLGDEEAFATLVHTYSGRLLAVARRLLDNDEDARDAVQDSFLSCFKSLDKFKGEARLSTWLHRIVVNSALMKIRARKGETSIEGVLPEFYKDGHRIDPGPAWRQTAEDELADEETRKLIRDKIALLPDQYRTVLVLRDMEQLDTETTARLLGKSSNVVKVRLHRARQVLRTHLDPYFRSNS